VGAELAKASTKSVKAQWKRRLVPQSFALGQDLKWSRQNGASASPSILLQKSFWGEEQKFLEPLMRLTRGDVRDHIVSSKIDH
jgi:hypothetical protein